MIRPALTRLASANAEGLRAGEMGWGPHVKLPDAAPAGSAGPRGPRDPGLSPHGPGFHPHVLPVTVKQFCRQAFG